MRTLVLCAVWVAVARGQEPPPADPPAVEVSAPPPKADGVPLRAKWKDGLRLESEDGAFRVLVGGRAQFDVANYIAPAGLRRAVPGANRIEDGVAFRRARLDVGGTVHESIDFYVQFDFVNSFVTDLRTNRATNVPAPTDLWVTFRDVPNVGNVRVGNHKPPIAFEHLTSSRFLNFLERSPAFDAVVEGFNNGFAPGVSVFDTYADRRGTWAVGLFKSTRGPFGFNVGRGEHDLTGRVTGLPVWEDDGRRLVHLGLGASYRDPDDGQQRFRSRLSVRNSPSAIAALAADTGLLFASRQALVVPELVAVCGPWSFQSEYYLSWLTDVRRPDADGFPGRPVGTYFAHGGYAEVHYFLTGEHRAYDRKTGVFGRVEPINPARWVGGRGLGAVQLTARYAYLDLTGNGIQGGVLHDLTLGLNWFLNPNLKVQTNYVLTHREAIGTAGDGFIHSFGTRLAWDF